MRIPLDWLAEYVTLDDASPEAVLARLVSVGLEEESIILPEVSGPVVVGQVLSAEPEKHSNGKTINWCSVQVAPEGTQAADGGEAVHGIVCGAHNFKVGDKVVVTLPGATLPGDFHIAARKTYGHVSDGMMASARELGLGDDHDGIIVLSTLGLDPEVGTDAKALLGLDTTTVEINVTPDRGYAFSLRGVARDYAHATRQVFADPVLAVEPIPASGFSVTINDEAPIRNAPGIRAFSTRVVEGVNAQAASPVWMQARLRAAGIRSVSLIVDITNYVMLEFGTPIHAYDLDRVVGGLTVRRAQPGEHLTTLDGADRALDPEDLVIADDEQAIGLAGVMGGESTEVCDTTTRVLVESANFDPVSIARSARRHKLPSEASRRFERGVDPTIMDRAATRVVNLITELAGGTVSALGSDLDVLHVPRAIELDRTFTPTLIGVPYTDDEQVNVLTMIGAEVEPTPRGWRVLTPPWRPDIVGQPDLAEEIARIEGYDAIPSVLPVAPPGHGLTFAQQVRRRIADAVADAGAVEVMAYPFVSNEQNEQFASAEQFAQVKLANPIDAKVPFLRRHLLPGLLDVAKRNAGRGFTSEALFELGSVFRPEHPEIGTDQLPLGGVRPSDAALAELNAGLPDQPQWFASVHYGYRVEKQVGVRGQRVDWQDAVTTVREVCAALGLSAKLVLEQTTIAGLHPGRAAAVLIETAPDVTEQVGIVGELHPDLAAEYDLNGRIAVAELDVDKLTQLAPRVRKALPLSIYPAATQDVSLIVAADIPALDVQLAVTQGAGELLEDIRLVDDFRGDVLGEGKKSLTFALRFRADDRTLTAAEASAAKDAGVEVASARFGAKVRA